MLPSLNTTTLMYRDTLASYREAEASGGAVPPYTLLVHNGDISYSRWVLACARCGAWGVGSSVPEP